MSYLVTACERCQALCRILLVENATFQEDRTMRPQAFSHPSSNRNIDKDNCPLMEFLSRSRSREDDWTEEEVRGLYYARFKFLDVEELALDDWV